MTQPERRPDDHPSLAERWRLAKQRWRRFGDGVMRYGALFRDPSTPPRHKAAYLLAGFWVLSSAVVLGIFLYGILLIPFTPGISQLQKAKFERPSVVLARDGERIAELKPLNREWVSLDQIAPVVVDALIATEDHRFYDHHGVDLRRVVGAGLRTIAGDPQGGSTLTQQLARNLYPESIGREVSLTRKLKELITALKIEIAYTKEEILETYLNTVPFLYNAYGIEMAARTYFGESASDLDVLEAATLVGMLKGTYYYNPVGNPERALQRRNVVLSQMVKRDVLEEEEYERLRERPLGLDFSRQQEPLGPAPHFTQQVKSWLIEWADKRGFNIYRDSLVVHTSLDLELQEIAQRSIDRWMPALQAVAAYEWDRTEPSRISRSPDGYRYAVARGEGFGYLWESRPDLLDSIIRQTPQFRSGVARGLDEGLLLDSLRTDTEFLAALRELKTRLEAGFVAMDPTTGEVRAWIGSRDFEIDQYDHVARARRQPGSTFKPFVYAAALEEGFRPDDTFMDEPIEMELAGGEIWRPQNVGSYSNREMTLAEGLIYSKNTITAQLVQEVGTNDVARLARRMGVRRSNLEEVPSIALGTSEVSLLEMVAGYSTLASGGVYRPPVMVTRIYDREGELVYEAPDRARRVLSEETALRVVDMMQGVVDRGTGTRIRNTFGIRGEVAGKTGTTQNNADGWFILMHPELVAGAWVGFNDPRIAFRSDYWGQGGNNALFLVGEFFRQALNDRSVGLSRADFPDPPPLPEGPQGIVGRVADWIGNAASDVGAFFGSIIRYVGEKVFGIAPEDEQVLPPEERDSDRRGLRYASDKSIEDEGWEVADSLTRAARDSTQLADILARIRDRSGGTGDSQPPPTPEANDTPESEEAAQPETVDAAPTP
ncbi:MAG TPA: PBP1A family penicillin-binding protein [Rhodothermales bacterium]